MTHRRFAVRGGAPGDVVIAGGRIESVGATADPDLPAIDAGGLVVAPGYLDLQCNGAVGIDLAAEPDRLWEVAAALPRWGVTAWLPTIVSSPPEVVDAALAALAQPPPELPIAVPVGLHLEGPFLAPARRGAHDARHLVAPTSRGWRRGRGVAMVTLAPELPGALDVVHELAAAGVVVAAGHSAATAAEARAGIDAGITFVTHLFNAMAPLHHREPGLAGVALTDRRVRVGLIADGVHVDPMVVAMANGAAGDRLVLVSDATGHLVPGGDGAPPRQPDGTMAGSALSLDAAVRNLVAFTGCDLATAVAAATSSPAAAVGDAERGVLAAGARADLVLLDAAGHVAATLVGGEPAYEAEDGAGSASSPNQPR